jgi:hypothetical protein
MERKNYNLDYLTGGDTTDIELCAQYGINPAYANTPRINDEMFRIINESSVRDMMKAGKTRQEAIEESNKFTRQAKQRATEILGDK